MSGRGTLLSISFQNSLIHPTLRILNNVSDPNDSSLLASMTETWNISDDSDSRRDSVLGQFPADSVISRLAEFVFLQFVDARVLHSSLFSRKDNSKSLGQSLFQILSSKRTNDEISNELAKLLGFEELELVAEILADRFGICTEVFHSKNLLEWHLISGNSFVSCGIQISSLQTNRSVRRGVFCYLSKRTDSEWLEQTFTLENIRQRMQEQLEANAAQPLFRGTAVGFSFLAIF